MSKLFAITSAVLLLTLTSAASQDVPNLVGTWQGPFRAQMIGGFTTGRFTLTIDSQDQELFAGHKLVERSDDSDVLTSAGGRLVRNPSEDFIGVISADGNSFYLAEVGDPGWYDGRIVDADTIEVTYVESGSVPVVHRTTLHRQD